jgi:DNA-binding PucR family transcriptional regulator
MDARHVDRSLGEIARDCEAEVVDLAVTATQILGTRIPEMASVPQMTETINRMANEHCWAVHTLFLSPVPRDEVRPAPITVDFAKESARSGLSAVSVLRTYQMGHELLWGWWSPRVAARITDAEARAAVTTRLGDLLMTYISEVMSLTVQVHADEVETRTRGASWQQRDTVLAILDKTSSRSVEELSRRLGYELDGWHVGFVLWSIEENDDWAGLETSARAWASGVAVTPPLLVPVDGSSIWGWLVSDTPPMWLDAAIPAPRYDLRAAIGQPGRGLTGFRNTHYEALRTRAIAPKCSTVVRHSQLATISLLRDDHEPLRRFVEQALGGLAIASTRQQRLRATVRGYLLAGENVRAAARDLHFHRNTIQQRLDIAAELRGRPLHEDRLNLALALEIVAHYGDDVLRSDT